MIKKIYKFIKEKILWFFIGGTVLASGLNSLPAKMPVNISQRITNDGIEVVLRGKNHKDKAKIKSLELSKVKFNRAFTKNGIKIKIVGDITPITVNGNEGIQLFAQAWKNGKQLGFGKEGTVETERFRIFNPPVLVDSPTGDIIREWIDEDTKELKQRKLRYDPTEAIKQDLVHTINLVGKDGTNIVKGKVGNTTSTFYPSAGSVSPVDGGVRHSSGSSSSGYSWATLLTKTGNEVQGDATVTMTTGWNGSSTADEWNIWKEAIMLFDTSPIPDGDNIDSATLSTYGVTKADPGSNAPTFNVFSSNPASNSTLVGSDLNNNGSTAFSSDITYANISTTGYNDWTLNSSGLLNIDNTGLSKFSHRETTYVVGSGTPTWVTWLGSHHYECSSADETGTTQDPKLVVVHSGAVVIPIKTPDIIWFE